MPEHLRCRKVRGHITIWSSSNYVNPDLQFSHLPSGYFLGQPWLPCMSGFRFLVFCTRWLIVEMFWGGQTHSQFSAEQESACFMQDGCSQRTVYAKTHDFLTMGLAKGQFMQRLPISLVNVEFCKGASFLIKTEKALALSSVLHYYIMHWPACFFLSLLGWGSRDFLFGITSKSMKQIPAVSRTEPVFT